MGVGGGVFWAMQPCVAPIRIGGSAGSGCDAVPSMNLRVCTVIRLCTPNTRSSALQRWGCRRRRRLLPLLQCRRSPPVPSSSARMCEQLQRAALAGAPPGVRGGRAAGRLHLGGLGSTRAGRGFWDCLCVVQLHVLVLRGRSYPCEWQGAGLGGPGRARDRIAYGPGLMQPLAASSSACLCGCAPLPSPLCRLPTRYRSREGYA